MPLFRPVRCPTDCWLRRRKSAWPPRGPTHQPDTETIHPITVVYFVRHYSPRLVQGPANFAVSATALDLLAAAVPLAWDLATATRRRRRAYPARGVRPWRCLGVFDVGVFDVGVFDVGVFDVGVFDVGVFDVGVFDVGVFDVGVFDVGVFDVGVFDVGVFDVGVFDVGVFELGVSDVGVSELGVFDAAAASSVKAESSASVWESV